MSLGEGAKRRTAARGRGARLAISGALLVVFLLHVFGVLTWGVLTQVENFFYDWRVRELALDTQDSRVVIVDIDERSLAVEGQWPWPRDTVARLVDELFEHYGAQIVGFDVVFAEPDKSGALMDKVVRRSDLEAGVKQQLKAQIAAYQPDAVLAEAIRNREVVLGYVFRADLLEGEASQIGVLPPPTEVQGRLDARLLRQPRAFTGNLAVLQAAASGAGFFDNPLIDRDGSMRRAPLLQIYDGKLYESLPLALTRRSLNAKERPLIVRPAGRGFVRLTIGKRNVITDENLAVLVPYRGGQGAFPYVAATDVLTRKAPIDTLFNAIVLIGTTAPGLLDLRTTPVGHAYAGVEVHANVISGLLDDSFRHEPANREWIEAAMLLVIGLALALLLPAVSPVWASLLVAGLIGGTMLLSLVLWVAAGLVLPMATPLFYALAVTLLQMTYSFLVESRNKRRLSKLFGQYVPPELVTEMDQSQEDISLEGTSREMTVLFSDVRGFTKISESMEPKAITELMNAFLTPITRVIHQHRGTVDKYMGDAVMAFWGAPMSDPQHATHALEAALAMQEVLRDLQPQFRERGWPPIGIGIGLNTGVMNVGNMGSEFRVAYTVLGDAVNLGSRLEGLTREYEVDIVVSETTVAQVQGYVFRELDRVRVKGKAIPVSIYEPVCAAAQLRSDQREELGRYETALGAYRAKDWDQAERGFRYLMENGGHPLYTMYLERIVRYRTNPPPPDWDGVFTYTTK